MISFLQYDYRNSLASRLHNILWPSFMHDRDFVNILYLSKYLTFDDIVVNVVAK